MAQHLVRSTERHLRSVGDSSEHNERGTAGATRAATVDRCRTTGYGQTRDRRVVAHIVSHLADDAYESVIAPLAGQAAAVGLRLVVVELAGAGGRVDDPADAARLARLTSQGVEVHRLGIERFSLRSVARLANVLRRSRVDVAHTHGRQADIVGGLAAREAGVPAVSTLRDATLDAITIGAALRLLAGRGARRRFHDRVLVGSQADLVQYAERTGATNLVLSPTWAAEAHPSTPRDRVRAELGVDARTLLLMTVAPLRADRGLVDLLGAVARLPRQTKIALVVVGDGPMRDLLRDDVRLTPTLCDRVSFVGDRTDMDDLIGAADIVVDPSIEADLPPVVLAALAAGKPVVATDVGSIRLAVTDGVGALVPRSNPTALALALMRLIDDAGLRAAAGRAARHRHQSTFAVDAWATGLAAMYGELVEARHGSGRRAGPNHCAG